MPTFEGIRALMLYGGVKILFPRVIPLGEQSRGKCPVQDIGLVSTDETAQPSSAIGPWAPSTRVGDKKIGPLECPKASGGCLDRFVSRQNIERCRRLANQTTSGAERLQVMKLLAEDEANFRLEFNVTCQL
jgi:hypothetical protein